MLDLVKISSKQEQKLFGSQMEMCIEKYLPEESYFD